MREPLNRPAVQPGAPAPGAAAADQAEGTGARHVLAEHGQDPEAVADALAAMEDAQRERALAELHGAAGNQFVGQVVALLPVAQAGTKKHGGKGGKKGKQAAGPLSSRSAAVAFHAEAQAKVAKVIRKGLLSKQAQLRNSCEWIEKGLCETVVLTPTHDAAERAAAMEAPGAEAVFDLSTLYPGSGGSYPEVAAAGDAGVGLYPPGFEGWMMGGRLTIIVRPGMDPERIEGIIMHEVQHQADQHEQGGAGHAVVDAYEDAHNSYRSEFRAYWIGDGGPGQKNDPFGSPDEPATNFTISAHDEKGEVVDQPTNLANQRQQRILAHLVASYPWVATTYVADAAFREMVDGFSLPVGVNVVNSVRIQALTDAIGVLQPDVTSTSRERSAVVDRTRDLDDVDREFLRDRAQSRPFWDHARAHLPHEECVKLQRGIDRETMGDFGGGKPARDPAPAPSDGGSPRSA